ncbi:MAG: prepilin-type N-terminal cleavage/methylation domain-containing protein [Elusimicrobiaceae bacterium]|jgi:prepilin-type N-terminal cleavage/methylation domain-containing protein
MKAKSFGRSRGMTIIEVVVASSIFGIFIVQFASVWISTGKQILYVLDRARVNREAHTARTLILTDMSVASSVTLLTDADGFNICRLNGSTVTYSLDSESRALQRYDTATSSGMTAAKLLVSLDTALGVKGMTAALVFERSGASVTLDIARNTALNTSP